VQKGVKNEEEKRRRRSTSKKVREQKADRQQEYER
jgi:hypothetical protein